MPRQYDLSRLRYPASLVAIAAGVALLILVAVADLDGSSKPSPIQTIAPLVKGRPEECPPDWRFVDNTDQRYTVCLPLNLLAFDGRRTRPFEELQPSELRGLYHSFVVVNDAWLFPPPEGAQLADVFAPISLKLDVVAPQTGFSGCNPRTQPADPRGSVSCADRLQIEGDQAILAPDGAINRRRVLIPTLEGKGVNEAFSLYLTIESVTEYWPGQERLFGLIGDSLRPY